MRAEDEHAEDMDRCADMWQSVLISGDDVLLRWLASMSAR